MKIHLQEGNRRPQEAAVPPQLAGRGEPQARHPRGARRTTRPWPPRSRPNDKEIDRLEVEVEEDCLKILALHQPVAVDLRFLIAALKMNNDLERIGDLAVNIAGVQPRMRSRNVARPSSASKFRETGREGPAMLRKSLESLMEMDRPAPGRSWKADDEVDDAYHDFVDIAHEPNSTGDPAQGRLHGRLADGGQERSSGSPTWRPTSPRTPSTRSRARSSGHGGG